MTGAIRRLIDHIRSVNTLARRERPRWRWNPPKRHKPRTRRADEMPAEVKR